MSPSRPSALPRSLPATQPSGTPQPRRSPRHRQALPQLLAIPLFTDSLPACHKLDVRDPAVPTAGGDSQGADPDVIRKDLRTLAEKASVSFSSPVAERARAMFDEASHDGLGRCGRTWLPAFWAIRATPADFEGGARA